MSYDRGVSVICVRVVQIPGLVGIVKATAAAQSQNGGQPTFENSEIRRITINIIYNISLDEKHRNTTDTALAPAIPLVRACNTAHCTLHSPASPLHPCGTATHISV